MNIGDWQIQSLTTGMFRLDGGAMFGVVPRNLWAKVAPPDEENRISMAMRTIVAVGRGKTVIVDTGAGTGYGEKFEKIYAFEAATAPSEGLGRLGITPETVTDVIVTHLHFDHGGGAVVWSGDGWTLAFPNAAHHVQTAQWEHALNPNPRDRASYFRDRIEPIEKKGALVLQDGGWALAPGLDVLVFHGHTPGQHLPLFRDGKHTLFFCGDLIPTAAHIPTPYIMAYDVDPVLAMDEKTAILERAARESWILFFEHDPQVEACRVRLDEGRITMGEPVSV